MQDCNFSEWVHISKKAELLRHGYNCPGIYAIAYSNENISDITFDYIEEIIYFGLSRSKKGLKGRLYQFFSVIDGKGQQHGGAKRISHELSMENNNCRENIFISIMPCIFCDVSSNSARDLLHIGDIVKEEYVCFSKYVERHNKMPRFNIIKKNSAREVF